MSILSIYSFSEEMVELKSAGNENEDEGFSELSAKVAGQVQNGRYSKRNVLKAKLSYDK